MDIDWLVRHEQSQVRLQAGFTSRHGGVSSSSYDSFNCAFHVADKKSDVEANRERLEDELGTQPAWMEQVHSSHIAFACPGDTADNTDGLILDFNRMDVDKAAACVMVADCIPLVLIGRDKPCGAVVHVGRAGFSLDIATKAVEALDTELIAAIGPSICGSCYEVSEDMCAQAAQIAPEAASVTSWGSPAIDIRAGLVHQLRTAGVEDIRQLNVCTYENEDYFSYRRACQEGNGATGRFLGVLLIERF